MCIVSFGAQYTWNLSFTTGTHNLGVWAHNIKLEFNNIILESFSSHDTRVWRHKTQVLLLLNSNFIHKTCVLVHTTWESGPTKLEFHYIKLEFHYIKLMFYYIKLESFAAHNMGVWPHKTPVSQQNTWEFGLAKNLEFYNCNIKLSLKNTWESFARH